MAAGGNVELVWGELLNYLSPSAPQFLGTLSSLEKLRQNQWVFYRLREWFLEKCQKDFKENFRPQFWSQFQKAEVGNKTFKTLTSAVNELHIHLSSYRPFVELLDSLTASLLLGNLKAQFEVLVRAVIFCDTPEEFKSIVYAFYSHTFQAYQYGYKTDTEKIDSSAESSMNVEDEDEDETDDGVESLKCMGCKEEKDGCQCLQIIDNLKQVNSQLYSLGLMKKVAEPAVLSVIHTEIQVRIKEKCRGVFECSFLASLTHWIDTKLSGWLRLIFTCKDDNATDQTTTEVSLDEWKPKLHYFMYKSFADLRIDQLFDIIVEYPDSLPAIQDLKECLEVTDQRKELIVSLRTAFEQRLLHPGANTSDILTQYVSAIRALHVLDPTGVILEHVCAPVRQYLRTREDTVRCIVTSLTDENSTELAEELMRGDARTVSELGALDSEDEDNDDENWMPPPSDADPDKMSSSRKAPDIISMLVNVYGSTDLFVSEYRTLLADRLLASFNYDTEKELRYLELLKLRFGESHLHFCEIMLKDVADSRRINSHIQVLGCSDSANVSGTIPLTAMVLSAVFWPAFRDEKLKVSNEVQKAMDEYTKGFEALKGMRTLRWKPHLGLVNIDVELADRTLSLSVTPAQATALMHFQDKERWTLEELSGVMQAPAGLLRRRLGFWISQGVLKEESTDTFVVVEKQKGQQRISEVVMDAEVESVMASSQDQREEELQVFWSYIVGMLTNLESLPLDRIHSMLRMFAMQGPSPSQCSVDDLRRFLDRKVKDQELQFVNGFYRLPKSTR
ncbi:anaphase-promoting complex subunit 2-like [Acropora millepora]|uniref:anaphase-promoting complex subunit 2-like n=1 Tax=Acropora millepora TaxID=45264 RepID=UPI001CF3E775|nr:anaphase-promoting complex subunit 2-like [Acropora millepora]